MKFLSIILISLSVLPAYSSSVEDLRQTITQLDAVIDTMADKDYEKALADLNLILRAQNKIVEAMEESSDTDSLLSKAYSIQKMMLELVDSSMRFKRGSHVSISVDLNEAFRSLPFIRIDGEIASFESNSVVESMRYFDELAGELVVTLIATEAYSCDPRVKELTMWGTRTSTQRNPLPKQIISFEQLSAIASASSSCR